MDINSIRTDVEWKIRNDDAYMMKVSEIQLSHKGWSLSSIVSTLQNPITCDINTLADGSRVIGDIHLSEFYPWLYPVWLDIDGRKVVVKVEQIEKFVSTTQVRVETIPNIILVEPFVAFCKGEKLDKQSLELLQSTLYHIRYLLMLKLAKKRIDNAVEKIRSTVVSSTKI